MKRRIRNCLIAVVVILTSIVVYDFYKDTKVSYVPTQKEVFYAERLAHDDLMKLYSTKYGVPMELMATVQILETGYLPKERRTVAKSRAGAKGVMQIMGFHAKRRGDNPIKLYEPEYNIELSAIILSYILKRNNGSIEHALAEYNGGRGQSRLTQKNRCYETRKYVERGMRLYEAIKGMNGKSTSPKYIKGVK